MRKSPRPRSQEVSAAHLPFLWRALQQRRQDLRLPGPFEDRHEGLRLLGLEGLAQDALQQALVLQRLARDGYLEALDHVAMREEVRELVQLLNGTQVHGARIHRILHGRSVQLVNLSDHLTQLGNGEGSSSFT